jgi:hypothetical protein
MGMCVLGGGVTDRCRRRRECNALAVMLLPNP